MAVKLIKKNVDMAPRGGEVILSDMGFVRYFRQSDVASAINEGWYLCDYIGCPIDLDDENVEISWWVSLDDFTLGFL